MKIESQSFKVWLVQREEGRPITRNVFYCPNRLIRIVSLKVIRKLLMHLRTPQRKKKKNLQHSHLVAVAGVADEIATKRWDAKQRASWLGPSSTQSVSTHPSSHPLIRVRPSASGWSRWLNIKAPPTYSALVMPARDMIFIAHRMRFASLVDGVLAGPKYY